VKKRSPALAVILLAALALACANKGAGTESSWIVGTWDLAYDPDGSRKDQIIFKADGTVINRVPGEPDQTGKYAVRQDTIRLDFSIGGKAFSIEMKTNQARDRLYLHSPGTGSTSEYARAGT
jgi:hypothetical protein